MVITEKVIKLKNIKHNIGMIYLLKFNDILYQNGTKSTRLVL